MATARVFKSGNSQAVRLPKKFRFDAEEVEIFRRGDELILRAPRPSLAGLADLLGRLPADFPDRIEDVPAQEREAL